mmetsp:Transcript_129512/g.415176  ORF Transcript_129512/g.415176 Transcript_129512/m.415176 type:complete len:229 (-) Transcript_129512:1674-2360(-)
MVLATLEPSPELAGGHQQVEVVRAHEILRKIDDGVLQRHLAVVVGSLLGDVTDKLGNLNVSLELLLEGAVDDLALRRLEAVHHARDGSHDVVLGELHELLVHKIIVGQGRLRVVDVVAFPVVVDPLLAVIGSLLVERKVDGLAVLVPCPPELDLMGVELTEVLLCLLHCTGPQPLVVLRLPSSGSPYRSLPLVILVDRKETLFVMSLPIFLALLPRLYDRGYEFLEKA